jgi:mono/diheme cytochrome c family protein
MHHALLIAGCLAALIAQPAQAQPAAGAQEARVSAQRGKLLYETHCISCHSSQVHWRDQRLARDWTGLQAQVARWQGNAGLNWGAEDIVEVSRYLNRRYYRFAVAEPRKS